MSALAWGNICGLLPHMLWHGATVKIARFREDKNGKRIYTEASLCPIKSRQSRPRRDGVWLYLAEHDTNFLRPIFRFHRSRRDPQRDRYQRASARLRPYAVNSLWQRVALHELARALVGLLLLFRPLFAHVAARFAPLGMAAA
jgi:hypothetical protein